MRVPLSWLSEFVNIKDKPEVLAEKLQLAGTKIESLVGEDDDVIFISEITSNRPDCLSIYGTAREVSVVTNQNLAKPHWQLPIVEGTRKSLTINVPDPRVCPVYTSVILDNIHIAPSPAWLSKRLAQVGVRSLNNVVDITNYVMFEYGIPMHVFDFDQFEGDSITMRASRRGERLITLDGSERVLEPGAVIIEDEKKIIDLAGIMGGANSEVTDKTTSVFLHVAIYDPIAVRQASKYLGVRSESSTRFEKKLDLLSTYLGMVRATILLMETAAAKIASPIYEFNRAKPTLPALVLRGREIEQLVGIKIAPQKIKTILEKLEFSPTIKTIDDDFELSVIAPSFRRDIQINEDIVEEIVRIYGYNKLPLTLPQGSIPTHPDAFESDLTREVKSILVGLGFTEVYGSTLISSADVEAVAMKPAESLAVLHPMSSDFAYMRPSLLPGLLQMSKNNLHHTQIVELFEIGTVFQKKKGDLPNQPEYLGIVTTLNDYFRLKGKVERLLTELGIVPAFLADDKDLPAYYTPRQAASIAGFGYMGCIATPVTAKFGIEIPILAVELFLDHLARSATGVKPYPPTNKFPPTIEDISFIIPRQAYLGSIIAAIQRLDPRIVQIDFLGKFTDTRSLRITYQDQDMTLRSEDVAKIREKIIGTIEKNFGAKVKRV